MASIRKRTLADGSSAWLVRYWTPAGTQRARQFGDYQEARRFAKLVEADKLRGDWVDPSMSGELFGTYAEETEAHRGGRRDSTKLRDEIVLRKMILPTFAETRLRSVSTSAIRRWISALEADGYAATSIHKAAQILGRVLDTAVLEGYLPRSPFRGIRLPKAEPSEKRFLSPAEVKWLAATIDPRYRALVMVGAYTGLRIGELAGLRPEHFDAKRRTLLVVKGKTAAAARTVTLPDWLAEELRKHIDVYSSGEFIFGAPRGGRLRADSFRTRFWNPAVEASVGHPCRIHDLRHTQVALLIDTGTPPSVIAARLGHRSVKTVLDVYGHLYPHLDRDAAERLERP